MLGEVVKPAHRGEAPVSGTIYRQIGVKLWGQGAYEREPLEGGSTRYARLFRAAPGDIIMNKIWARNGSVAVVPVSLAGCMGSSEFPMFAPSADRLEPRWMHWLTKTPGFWTQCDEKSRGTSGKNRIRPERFLEIKIPLPPLEEQRLLVARIEELAARIHDARRIRDEGAADVEKILAAREMQLWPIGDSDPTLEDLTSFLARGRQSEQGESDHFLVKTQHVQQDQYVPTNLRLAFHKAAKVGPEARLRDGDVLIACSAAGCLGRVAQYLADGRTASADTHIAIARPNPQSVEPLYLYAYLRGAQGQLQLRSRERGDWQREKVGFRLTELNLRDLRTIPVPLPSRQKQLRIVAELDALRVQALAVKRIQSVSATELDALMPAILDRAFKGEL